MPDKEKTNWKSVLLDTKIALTGMGLKNVKKVLARESHIKKIHPRGLFYYLWFIGVENSEQGERYR